MRPEGNSRGFSMLEVMVATSIFALVMGGIFMGMDRAHKTLKFEAGMDSMQGAGTALIEQMGTDIRESSYAYLFAGDWYASKGGGNVTIDVARNYFSSNPVSGGATLVPGISNENFSQCPNPSCGWSNRVEVTGIVPNPPMAFLGRPIRNNLQSVSPLYPPPSLQFSNLDARGRLFSHVPPGNPCPVCGTTLSSDAYFSGLLLFSPRLADGSFSYINGGNDEVQWEALVFYCPLPRPQGGCEIRRYVFYASMVNAAASLTDLLDFDGNGLIESPPMTDQDGDFVLDADGEIFCMIPVAGGNDILYTRWDTGTARLFRLELNRTSGVANVTVIGGPYAGYGTKQVQLRMDRYATGLSDFDASTFINNPSWESMGTIINPTGVMELGVLRVTFQIDRQDGPPPGYLESVQSTMFRPRN